MVEEKEKEEKNQVKCKKKKKLTPIKVLRFVVEGKGKGKVC